MAILAGYIGTYSSPQSHGVYRFTLHEESGELGEAELFYKARDAKCVAIHHNMLAIPIQKEGRAGLTLLDTNAPGAIYNGELCYEKRTSCDIAFGDCYLCSANYHEGLVMVYHYTKQLKLAHRIEIGKEAGCHQVLYHQQYLLIPCLERDEIQIFNTQEDFTLAGKLLFPYGSGPRHGVFDKGHKHLYVVTERSHMLYVYQAEDAGRFTQKCVYPVLDADGSFTYAQSTSAAIRLSPDEKFLYITTRGSDILTVFLLEDGKAERIQQIPCGGKHPRDMVLSPDGRFILVLGRDSNSLICRELQNGYVGNVVSEIEIYNGSGLVLDACKAGEGETS